MMLMIHSGLSLVSSSHFAPARGQSRLPLRSVRLNRQGISGTWVTVVGREVVVTVVVVEVVDVCTVVDDLVEVEVDVSSIVVEREVGSFVVAVVVLVVVVNGGEDVVEGFSQFWHWSVTSPSCT